MHGKFVWKSEHLTFCQGGEGAQIFRQVCVDRSDPMFTAHLFRYWFEQHFFLTPMFKLSCIGAVGW